MRGFKLWAATLLRKWAQSLDGVKHYPSRAKLEVVPAHLKQYKIDRAIKLYDRRLSRNFAGGRERLLDIIKQETIIEAAADLSQILYTFEQGDEIKIRGEFYVRTNDQTNL